jgi:A/G-specific adenine glycosylase
LSGACRARAGGAPETYPFRSPKADRPHRHGVAFRLRRGDRVALVRRPPKGLLGGMLGLPTTPWRSDPWSAAEAMAHAPGGCGWKAAGEVEHVFTHFSLTLAVLEGRAATADPAFVWTPLAEALQSTPSVFAKALKVG